jgi:hypothetical protein
MRDCREEGRAANEASFTACEDSDAALKTSGAGFGK